MPRHFLAGPGVRDPQMVPAFAATETFARFRKKFNNFKYKEAVLDPTNPRDLADEQERAIIGRFVVVVALNLLLARRSE